MTQQVVGYIRVSTAKQSEEGVSLEAQRARIEAWAVSQGAELLGIFTDAGISGGRADRYQAGKRKGEHYRPALEEALEAACKHHAVLLVYSLSRLARSTQDALAIVNRLNRGKADLVSLTEVFDTTSAAGQMVFTLLTAFAQFERDLTSERTRAAMQHKRSLGQRVSRFLPYGLRLAEDGELELDEEELEIRRTACRLRSEGLSLAKIGARLAEAGIFPRSGRDRWHPASVRSLLREIEHPALATLAKAA